MMLSAPRQAYGQGSMRWDLTRGSYEMQNTRHELSKANLKGLVYELKNQEPKWDLPMTQKKRMHFGSRGKSQKGPLGTETSLQNCQK